MSSSEIKGNASAETDGGKIEKGFQSSSRSRRTARIRVRARLPRQRCFRTRGLRVLEALLDSEECSSDSRQELLAYATQPHGRRACINMLHAQARSPRSLWSDAFAIVQELLGQLMLDAMHREESENLKTLVDVSHAISLTSCTECQER